jgi:carbonic anhydrase
LTSNENAGDGAPRSSNGSTLPEALMSNLRPLLERNRAFAATGAHAGLAIMPRQQVFLVTCLDPRVDPAAFLGVKLGDAPVIRNAGGRVTEAVINDIAFISCVARTMIPDGPLFEVAVVHHTGCGTGFLADAGFRSAFAALTGLADAVLAAEAVVDPAATVRADVERLLSSPKVPPQISVSGHVYDLQTGLITTIVDPSQPQPA